VQLAGEALAVFLMLLDHPHREPLEVGGPGLEPTGQIRVLECRADLLADSDQDAVIKRGEWGGGVSHDHQRTRRSRPPEGERVYPR
jgi:hypothetical protein